MARVKNNFTYVIALEGGAEEGPLSFEDLKPLLRDQKVVGSTFIKRSDRMEWTTAADLPELKVKDDVGGVDPFAADAVTQEIAKELALRKVRFAVSWLFWIGALSLLNSGLGLLGIRRAYAMGLGAAHLIAAFGDWVGESAIWISLGANVILSLGFLIVGVLAWHGRPGLLGPAVVVYVADAILSAIFEQWLSVGLHGLALLFLIPGFIHSFEARGLEFTSGIRAAHTLAAILLSVAGLVSARYLEKAATPEPAAWASSAPTKWPQISVANAAEFNGHSPLKAGNAFFIRAKNGSVLAATAKHLLGPAGGVEPAVKLADLNASITQWNLNSRTSPLKTAHVRGLHAAPDNYRLFNDWVLLQLAPEDIGKLPAEPLSPRYTYVQKGETVFLVGAGANGKIQEVHPATISETDGTTLTGEFEKPVDLVGYSGSPIVDSNGALVGVLTSSNANRDKEGKFKSFIAQSVAQVRPLLK